MKSKRPPAQLYLDYGELFCFSTSLFRRIALSLSSLVSKHRIQAKKNRVINIS